jgi:hypothetical protein
MTLAPFKIWLCAFWHPSTASTSSTGRSAMRSHAKAETLCEAKAPHPLVKPKPIHARRAEKVNWGDPGMRANLADTYKRAGDDDEKAARILWCKCWISEAG